MGTDGVDVQWRCEAEFDTDVAFDAVHVSCEGFRDADDPYVLQDSCGLEYRLKFTNAYYERKERNEREIEERRKAYANTRGESNTSVHHESNWGFKWFFIACAVVFAIVWCTKKSNRTLAGTPVMNPPRSTVDPSYAYGPYPTGPGFVEGVAVGAAAAGGPRHVVHNQHYTSNTYEYNSPSYESSSSYTSSYSPPSSPKKDTHTSTGFGTTSRR
jgi:hypothetical protein